MPRRLTRLLSKTTNPIRSLIKSHVSGLEGPRFAVGLFASGGCRFQTGNLNFESSKVGMKVFANAVGNVDGFALSEAERLRVRSHVPTDRASDAAHGGEALRRCRLLNQFETEMTFFHDAGLGCNANIASDKNWFRIAMPEGFELSQPAGQNGSDSVERQFRMNAKKTLWLACGQALFGAEIKASFEFRNG